MLKYIDQNTSNLPELAAFESEGAVSDRDDSGIWP